jgi:hypothetical protein
MLGTVFHYAVVQPMDDHAQCEAQKDGIIAMHERMGYRKGGAYNGHFCVHGGYWVSYRGPNEATGHAWANQNLNAWCYLATVDTPVTDAAAQAAYELTCIEPAGRDQIYPHSAFFPTACCGDPLREWIASGALPPTPSNIRVAQEEDVILVGRSQTDPNLVVAVHPVNGVLAVEFTCRVGEEVFGLPPSAVPYCNGTDGTGRGELPIRFVLPHVIDWLRLVQGLTLAPPVGGGGSGGGASVEDVRRIVRDEIDKTRLSH